MDRVIVIAEAGPNHNGKLKLAYKLVDLAKNCGANFVKFQTSIPELHISKFAKKANYQIKPQAAKISFFRRLYRLIKHSFSFLNSKKTYFVYKIK